MQQQLQQNHNQQSQNNNQNQQQQHINPKQEEDDIDDENSSQSGNDNIGPDGKKKYSVISQAVREQFIQRVLSKEVTIKEAAKEFGIKFSTSKAILQTYKKEGRIGKKKTRQRKPKNDINRQNSHHTPPNNILQPNPQHQLQNLQQQQFQHAQRMNPHTLLSPNLTAMHPMTPQSIYGQQQQQKSLIPGLGEANLAPLPIYKTNNNLIAKKKDSFSLDNQQQQYQQHRQFQQQQYQIQQHQHQHQQQQYQLQQSPQIDADIQNTMMEIKDTIQNKPNLQMGNPYNISAQNTNGSSGLQGQPGLIMNKLNKMKTPNRPLSIDTGNNVLVNSPNLRAQKAQTADPALFPNPFNENGNVNQYYRESPFDLQQIKNQLSSINVDQLKSKTYGLMELGDETDFNYNQYFQTQEIY